MSDLNPTSPDPGDQASSELAELKEQYAQLRTQTHNLRLAQLIVALAVAGFFWVEVRRNSQALQTMRLQAIQVEEVSKKQTPAIIDFFSRLAEFSRTHPDFVPVLAKYGISNASPSAVTGVPPAAPKK